MNYSYTFVNTYKKCHRRAFLEYISTVGEPIKVNARPFMVGTVLDTLFKKWIERSYPLDYMEDNAEGLYNWFEQRRHVIYKGRDDKEKMVARAQKVARILQDVAFDEGLPDRVIEPQKKVVYKGEPGFEEIDFYSKLDLWFPKENAIWDLKVTTYKKYLDEFQLYFFQWMIERTTGKKVVELAFLVPELKPSVIGVEVSESHRCDFEQELIGLLTEIKNEELWLPTAKDCWGCPMWGRCEKEDEDVVAIEKRDKGFRVFVGEDVLDGFSKKLGKKT